MMGGAHSTIQDTRRKPPPPSRKASAVLAEWPGPTPLTPKRRGPEGVTAMPPDARLWRAAMTLIPLSWVRHAKRMLTDSVTPQPDDWSRFQSAMKARENTPCTQWKGQARKERARILHEALAHANDEVRA